MLETVICESNGHVYTFCQGCNNRIRPKTAEKQNGLCEYCHYKVKPTPGIEIYKIFDAARESWRPVTETNDAGYVRWSQTAVECLLLNRDCSNCHISRVFNRNWAGTCERTKCHIPTAVQHLIDNGIRDGLRAAMLFEASKDE